MATEKREREYWLSGPIDGINPALQPVAHALLQAQADIERVCEQLHPAHVWAPPGAGTAPIGFHLRHLAGATDRLFTYARGEQLSQEQKLRLQAEKQPGDQPKIPGLLQDLRMTVQMAIEQLRNTPPDTLLEARELGTKKLPTTVMGLLFHAAEHASRHSGQIATTAKILQSLP